MKSSSPVTFSESERAYVRRQVESYKEWLAIQPTFQTTDQEVNSYIEQATQINIINGKEIVTFTPFRAMHSALRTFTGKQIAGFLVFALCLIGCYFVFHFVVLTVAMLLIIALYMGHLILDVAVIAGSIRRPVEEKIDESVLGMLDTADWPSYTILCPLYHEAVVVPQFVEAMKALDYPQEKLQVLFLTEEDDVETRAAIKAMNLPPHFQIVTVPDGSPRTKPRACNYGLMIATGQYIVIYDAEDMPDPLQLKKAVLTFANHGPRLACVQAKLNFYNSSQNLLTRLFTLEYSLWFDLILPGLQKTRLSLPLGGTSNHFLTKTLRALGGWDAFNVTEDCDLGLRLARYQFETAVLDSTTFEEANSQVKNWIRQRSRWIKGYMQTYLVCMRQPLDYLNPSRWREFLSLQLLIGGKTLTSFINPLMWILLIVYILFRPVVEPYYQMLFPTPVLYMGVFCLFFGNFFYFYMYLLGCAKRKQYGLVKWAVFIPWYWVLMSIAASMAFFELIFRPHYWQKTKHGLHLTKNQASALSYVMVKEETASNADKTLAAPSEEDTVSDEEKTLVALSREEEVSDEEKTLVASSVMAADTSHSGPPLSLPSIAETLDNLSPLPVSVFSTAQLDAVRTVQQTKVKDLWLAAIVFLACVMGLSSCWYFFVHHQLLLYDDAYTHLRIARGLIDNATPDLAQLGDIWLPLPHLLMVPFIWNDFLWRTGLAGACVSVPCYIIATVYIYLVARRQTHNSCASFIGTLVFVLNPNILYLQSTALSEIVCIAASVATYYYFLRWIQEDSIKNILLAAITAFLATLSSYDGWALFVALLVLFGTVSWFRRQPRTQVESNVIIFSLLGGLGIVLWLIWSKTIFGVYLYFPHSVFSVHGQQLDYLNAHVLYAYHNLGSAFLFYSLDTFDVLGPLVPILALISVVVFLLHRRWQPEMFMVFLFLLPFAFYVTALYLGQIVLWVPGITPASAPNQLFNVRYGVQMVAPVALFVAILVARWPSIVAFLANWRPQIAIRRGDIQGRHLFGFAVVMQSVKTGQEKIASHWVMLGQAVFIAAILLQTVLFASNGIITVQEGQYGYSCAMPHPINAYLAQHYAGGKILEQISSSKITGQDVGIDFHNFIYEGSGALWHNALANPVSMVDWVIARPSDKNDEVSKYINLHSSVFQTQFNLVVVEPDGDYMYHRISQSPLPSRVASPDLLSEHILCGQGY